jgi:hypothetical protein
MKRHLPSNRTDSAPEEAPEVWRAPHAIVGGPDGRSRWVALCPCCAERHEEAVVSGDEDEARGICPACGAIVEVCASGTYRVAPIVPRSST